MSLVPPFLSAGDTVAFVAPARKVSPQEMQPARIILENAGYKVEEGKFLYGEQHQFSGTDAERAADMQWALDNPAIKAIWCARGGYGCARFIDRLDFSRFAANPKWFIGFSDMTVIHNHIRTNYGIASLHAPMVFSMPGAVACTDMALEQKARSAEALLDFISGRPYSIPLEDQDTMVSGIVTGGNLSILYSMLGSASDIDTDGTMLFIEDLDEYLYHVDRMMVSLKRAGKLKALKALLVGGMNDMKDNAIPFGKTASEIILEHTAEYGYPVIFNVPAGHLPLNLPVPLGMHANIKNGILTFAAV